VFQSIANSGRAAERPAMKPNKAIFPAGRFNQKRQG
jgi:hypothetical protein